MDSCFEVYIDSLRRRLSRRWSVAEVEDAVLEVSSHLAESRRALEAEGRSPEASAAEALRRLGSDQLLAEKLIRARSGIDLRSSWRHAWLPSLLLVIATTLPLAFEHIDPLRVEPIARLVAWSSCAFLFALAVAGWRSRRVLAIPLAAAMSLSIAIVVVHTWTFGIAGFTGSSNGLRQSEIAALHGELQRLGSELAVARVAANGGEMPRDPMNGQYQAPSVQSVVSEADLGELPFISWKIDEGRDLCLVPTASEAGARQLWSANGALYARKIDSERREADASLAYWQSYTPSWRSVRWPDAALLRFAALAFVFCLAWNGLAVGMSFGRGEFLRRRWLATHATL